MTFANWASLILSLLSILGVIVGSIRFLVKHYFAEMKAELKPNSGSSLKDQVSRLEMRMREADTRRQDMEKKLDHMYAILIEYISKSK
jgi:chaperonin cofactor prefoldin